MSATPKRRRVGEIRPSQMLHSFGVGSVIDLPNISAMVLGLDAWDQAGVVPVTDARLLEMVKSQLGDQVERLCLPPLPADEASAGNPYDAAALIGIPVSPFPRWVRCPRCSLIAPLDAGVFQLKESPWRPDATRYVHANCPKPGKPPTVVPARFALACVRGHLDDFPWVAYVHRGKKPCKAVLRLAEWGVSGEASDIEVRCDACGAKRRMADAFVPDSPEPLFGCPGTHPHLRSQALCGEVPRAMLVGASNFWFSMSLSALSLPEGADPVAQLVKDHWPILKEVTSPEVLRAFRAAGMLAALAEWSDDQLSEAIQARRAEATSEAPRRFGELKRDEWRVLANPGSAPTSGDFELREVSPPPGYERLIRRVVLAERLREVRALIGFTRVSSPGDYGDLEELPTQRRAPLARRPPTWVPAAEVRGEGVFIEIAEAALSAWENDERVRAVEEQLAEAHRAWRAKHNISPPSVSFPGVRFVLLHSLAHALIRQLSIECGYSAASIRERIYALPPTAEGGPMAGLLLYTAAPDSEGTLGGLVGLGEPRLLARHLEQALERAQLCASDPLCAETRPADDGLSLHGAACHACMFAPETSCERGNKYLDRRLLVATVAGDGAPFFS